MTVKLLHHTPLWVASAAIRKCWASEGKSDTTEDLIYLCPTCNIKGAHLNDGTWLCTNEECKDFGNYYEEAKERIGSADKDLIHRVGNKFKHASTLEHLNYTFDIDGVSRALLQEQSRHRIASISVKSTRYTLKELKDGDTIVQKDNGLAPLNTKNLRVGTKFLVMTNDVDVDTQSLTALANLQTLIRSGKSNDIAKYSLPEAYKTSYVWTVNARSLQNFLSLRTDKSALWEIRDLANEIFKQIPEAHKYLFEEFVKVYNND